MFNMLIIKNDKILFTLDSPFCVLTEPMIVGASLHEAVKVNCLVSADPADVTFTWQFNNSGESFQVPSYR